MNSPLLQRAKELEARDRKIVRYAAQGMSYAQIGRKFGLTRQRVQQICKRNESPLFASPKADLPSPAA